jgi:hypothetical protein
MKEKGKGRQRRRGERCKYTKYRRDKDKKRDIRRKPK